MNAIQGFIAWALLRLVYPRVLAGVRHAVLLPQWDRPRVQSAHVARHRLGLLRTAAPALDLMRPTAYPSIVVCEAGSSLYPVPSASPYAALLTRSEAKHTAEARNG